jgi:CO/xanthine dehydrogenase Mo-binding subunit
VKVQKGKRMVTTERQYKVVGTRPIRHDGTDKVTGRARYGADLKLPGMLFGRVKRSPHAHARIKRIDVSKARALQGVRGVITFGDFPDPGERIVGTIRGPTPLKWIIGHLMADKKVVYRGQPVAAVAATDPHIAEDALELIDVEYEPLEPVLDLQEAMLDTAPIILEDLYTEEMAAAGAKGSKDSPKPSNIAKRLLMSKGDVAQGFAEADLVLEREYGTTMAHQGYIEPHTSSALWNQDGQLHIWTSTQGAFGIRETVAMLLVLPVSQITVTPMEIGGGFGGKLKPYYEPLAALLSKQTGRPVKMTMTRQEVLEASGPTSGTHTRVKIGVKRDGTIVAGELHGAYEAGAFPGSPFAAGARCAFGPYDIPNQLVETLDVVVNKPQVAAYRAPGAPASEFAVECLLDEIARQLDIDPLDLRVKNAAKQGTRRADGGTFGVIGALELMDAMRNSEHYRSELQGENVGRGIGLGFWFNGGNESAAYASVNADGTVSLVLGSVDIGGQRASCAMQLAETLGIGSDEVKPQVVGTDSIGFTSNTGGSRTTFATGWAVYEAAMDVRRQMEERAATIWDVDRTAVAYGADGVVRGPNDDEGKERSFTFKQLAAQLGHTGGMIQGRADVKPTTVGPAFAGHIADVQVDPETGKVQVLRYSAFQDVGTAIHPSYVEGQIQGGASQGIGMALTEEYIFGGDGRMQNSSLLDYRMPTTLDLPMIETHLIEVPNPGHPYGVRGVGEVPIVPPLSTVANAIHDAIGVRMTHLPASPRAILEELHPDD